MKNGQSVSLRTGDDIKDENEDVVSTKDLKRSASEEFDDDLLRSMGRRRKGAPPPRDEHHCKDCEKVFKRPCDLTYVSSFIPTNAISADIWAAENTRKRIPARGNAVRLVANTMSMDGQPRRSVIVI